MDDTELIRRHLENGSGDAFAELVRRHLNLVYSAALRRVGYNTHLADEVTQMVFVALGRNISSLADRRTLAGWLHTTSRFIASRAVRAERRRKTHEQEASIMNELTGVAETDLQWDKVWPELDAVMDRLKERDREALLLRFFENRRFAEVGLTLGVSEEAARKCVDRALGKLRALLARRGVHSASAAVAAMLANQAVVAAPAALATSVPKIAAATAAYSGSSGLGLLQVFSAAKMTAGIAAVLTLAAIGTAVYELRAAHRAEASLAIATQEYQGQANHLRALEQAAQAEDRNRDAIVQALQEWRRAAPRPVADPRGAAKRFLADFPEALGILRRNAKIVIEMKYDRFYKSANLTPGQIQQFEDREADAEAETLIITPAGDIRSNRSEALRGMRGQLREIFGERVEQEFETYTQMAPAQSVAGTVATTAAYIGHPLTEDQAYRVQQAALHHDAGQGIDWAAVGAEIKGILSPSQWKAAEPGLLGRQFNAYLRPVQAGLPAATTQ